MRESHLRALGRVVGLVVGRGEGAGARTVGRALLGHDGRRSGPLLERALALGLAEAGFQCESAGLITTPGLAHLCRAGDFVLGAMISASHNPASDNGVKVFGSEGEKLADELERRIEEVLHAEPAPTDEDATSESGSAPELSLEHEDRYLAHLLSQAEGLELSGLRIALDCANGGGSRVAPRVLGRLGAHVVTIASDPDGDNINQDCGSTHPRALQERVRLVEADLGIALDGDGDRCLLVDERGALVDGDGILAICARHAARSGRLEDPRIVATVMSNRGLYRALRDVDVSILTVPVGDRSVVEALRREHLTLGGEQSGHIVFGADNDFIGDGILTALRVLMVMKESGAPLSELAAPFSPFPQVLINVPVRDKPALEGLAPVADKVREIETALGEDGRVLLRYSGTEPLARVMVEGPDEPWIRGQAQALASLIADEIGA